MTLDQLTDKSLIGEILVALGHVSAEQIDEAMSVQNAERAAFTSEQVAAGKRPRLIGAILESLGYATETQVEEAFALQQKLRSQPTSV